ncbi:recombinase family protein [Pseudomonas fluorescens]
MCFRRGYCACIKDVHKGDVLLVESIDRFSRFPVEDCRR